MQCGTFVCVTGKQTILLPYLHGMLLVVCREHFEGGKKKGFINYLAICANRLFAYVINEERR